MFESAVLHKIEDILLGGTGTQEAVVLLHVRVGIRVCRRGEVLVGIGVAVLVVHIGAAAKVIEMIGVGAVVRGGVDIPVRACVGESGHQAIVVGHADGLAHFIAVCLPHLSDPGYAHVIGIGIFQGVAVNADNLRELVIRIVLKLRYFSVWKVHADQVAVDVVIVLIGAPRLVGDFRKLSITGAVLKREQMPGAVGQIAQIVFS